jgi:hypothetical protein
MEPWQQMLGEALAALGLAEARGGRRPTAAIDARHVAASFGSEYDGRPAGAGLAPLSRCI